MQDHSIVDYAWGQVCCTEREREREVEETESEKKGQILK